MTEQQQQKTVQIAGYRQCLPTYPHPPRIPTQEHLWLNKVGLLLFAEQLDAYPRDAQGQERAPSKDVVC